MSKNRKRNNWRGVGGPIFVVVLGLAVLVPLLLSGNNVALFNPKGLIADEQMKLLLMTVGIMLVIGIPAVFALYFIAWKYRESNHKAKRDPEAGHGKLINVTMWLAPAIVAAVLTLILWPATHKLEPKKEIAADAETMTVQVVAMRWKWLFIYPEQGIATVNYVQVPVDTPVRFLLTADEAPMSAFWVPNLGGMLYAMNGHVNALNLLAETPGQYPGSTAELTGAGFAGMRFTAHAVAASEFESWATQTKLSSPVLDETSYAGLLKPSEDNPEAYYSLADRDLYAKVVMKYAGGAHDHQPEAHHGGHH